MMWIGGVFASIAQAGEPSPPRAMARPRMDMPGGKPAPYPVDCGGLYHGFAGP